MVQEKLQYGFHLTPRCSAEVSLEVLKFTGSQKECYNCSVWFSCKTANRHRLDLMKELFGTNNCCLRKMFFKESLLCSFTFGFLLLFCASLIKERLEVLKCYKRSCSSCIFWPDLKKEALDISQESLFGSYCCWLGVMDMGAEPSKHFATNKSYNECCHFCIYELSTGRLENSQMYLLFTVIHELF